MARDAMAAAEAVLVPLVRRCGGCDSREDGSVEAMLQWQKVSDMLIAASLLSIPLELFYFATRDALAPLRRALLQLGTFVVLCGVTHLLNVVAYDHPGSRRVLAALTAVKALGVLASAAAAVSLPVFFPRVLRIKAREDLLRAKALRLDRDLSAVRRRQATAWRVVRALHIRDSVDACTIRRTTVLQLAAALDLHNCAVWMPMPGCGARDGVLHLVHQLLPVPDTDADQVFDGRTRAVSVRDPDVADVMASKEAKVLRPGSVLAVASGGGQPPAGAAAAIRLPILRVANASDGGGGNGDTSGLTSHAILVLILPANPNDHHRSHAGWSNQDLEIVESVADQVAVALSHAAALEDSELIRQQLAEQQGALLQARHDLASATEATNAAHGAMRDAVRRATHPVVGLLSVMQQEAAAMRPEQRRAVDALARTSALSSALMDADAMERLLLWTTAAAAADSAAARDHPPPPPSSPRQLVARRPFELRALIRNVAGVAGCLAGCRGIGFSHQTEATALPEWVVGDDRRVFHLLLHMVDALLSKCPRRHVAGRVFSFSVCGCNDIVGDDQDWIAVPARYNFSGGNHVFVKFQVALRRAPESDLAESLPASHRRPPRNPGPARSDVQLSVAMCKKIVQMMNGNMWSASDSEGNEETMTLILRFQLQQSLNPLAPGSGTYRMGASSSTIIPQHNFNGLRILLADSDAMSLEVTRKLLERLGCQVVPVSSGLACLTVLGSAVEPSFQLVVLDLDSHGGGAGTAGAAINGVEVAVRIRELSNTCWLLLVLVVALAGSSADDGGVRDVFRRAGVNGVIQKPITLPALGAELQRVLQN
ncbi:hypothetical protein EJB05_24837, partial [Eragrostis curvula]